jgi:hypothetical protein
LPSVIAGTQRRHAVKDLFGLLVSNATPQKSRLKGSHNPYLPELAKQNIPSRNTLTGQLACADCRTKRDTARNPEWRKPQVPERGR